MFKFRNPIDYIHNCISLAGYGNEASFWLCQDCTVSWERVGLVWHLHNHVRFLMIFFFNK